LHELGSCFFPIDQIIENIVAGFENYFGISFEEGNLSIYERELVENIASSTNICNNLKIRRI